MAVLNLTLDYSALRDRIGDFLGYGYATSSWSSDATKSARVQRCVDSAYRRFLTAYDWSFLKTSSTMYIWPDVAVGTATVSAATVVGTGTGTTTYESSIPVFTSDSVGKTITVAGVGSYTVASYVDSTHVTVAGTHTCSASAFSINGLTYLVASVASFYQSMEGKSIVVTTTGTYTIIDWVSTTTVAVKGDAFASAKTFSIASGGTFTMPNTFNGSIVGPPSVLIDSRNVLLGLTTESRIREFQNTTSTGEPIMVAVIVPSHDQTNFGTRFVLVPYPLPDSAYTITVHHQKLVECLSTTQPYPLGGPAHSETLLEACLAAAEKMLNDEAGLHEASYQELLAQSIRIDDRNAPDFVGNLGGSGYSGASVANYCTYDGVMY